MRNVYLNNVYIYTDIDIMLLYEKWKKNRFASDVQGDVLTPPFLGILRVYFREPRCF